MHKTSFYPSLPIFEGDFSQGSPMEVSPYRPLTLPFFDEIFSFVLSYGGEDW